MFVVLPFHRRSGRLHAGELVRCAEEDGAFRHGRSMMRRAAGVAFFRIDTAASGDQWTEIELLTTVGSVPDGIDDAA